MACQSSPTDSVPAIVVSPDHDSSSESESTPDSTDPADSSDSVFPDTGEDSQLVHAPISDVSVELHEEIATILKVSWTQQQACDAAWLEFSFEDDAWQQSPAPPRDAGQHSEVILGVPASSKVEFRVVNQIGDQVLISEDQWSAVTGELPEELPLPELTFWDPATASTDRWLLGSIDADPEYWFAGPFWLFILDRQGRVVWYYVIPDSMCSMFPRVSRDGTHLIFERNSKYSHFDQGKSSKLHRRNLDLSYAEDIDVAGLSYAFDETDDGRIIFSSFLESHNVILEALHADGARQEIWSCSETLDSNCYANAVNWVPETDTALFSIFSSATVLELDLQDGAILRQWGALEGSWSFDPPEAGFDWQHYPNYTDTGSLLVSTHVPGEEGQQRACEYAVDDESQTLTEIWSYGEGMDDYAEYAGEATRLGNGNTLINYGSGGVLREVTQDGQTSWELVWPERYLLGHNTLLHDLYALNEGP